jgi:hypothetical protein
MLKLIANMVQPVVANVFHSRSWHSHFHVQDPVWQRSLQVCCIIKHFLGVIIAPMFK